MKKILGAALALTLLGGTAAVAQPYGGYDRDNRGYTRDFRDNDRFDRFDRRWDRDNRWDRGDWRRWRRGMVFNNHYRFHVRDWHRYGLHRPGRGLFWVQQGPVFLLVNGRGLVVDVVYRPRGFGFY
jgi:Ni/Co efflux regulator RcnB